VKKVSIRQVKREWTLEEAEGGEPADIKTFVYQAIVLRALRHQQVLANLVMFCLSTKEIPVLSMKPI